MKTKDIEVGKTYLSNGNYRRELYEVLEVLTRPERLERIKQKEAENREKAKNEGRSSFFSGRHRNTESEQATIRVKVVGSQSPSGEPDTERNVGKERWVRPQDIFTEKTLGGLWEEYHAAQNHKARAKREAEEAAAYFREKLEHTGLPFPKIEGYSRKALEFPRWSRSDYERLIELLDNETENNDE